MIPFRESNCRYDYEEVDSDAANKMMDHLKGLVATGALQGKTLLPGYTVSTMDDFSYVDPVDQSVTKNQVVSTFCHYILYSLDTCIVNNYFNYLWSFLNFP